MRAAPDHYAEGPEALVVSLASKGDRDAFAELLRRRQSWIRNLMRRCSGDASLADDLSQQVFLQAWRKIRGLKDVDKFGSWLKRLAINEWLQYLRKNDPLRVADSNDDLPSSALDKTSIGMDLERALAMLPGAVSLCVVLSYHERMAHTEISEMSGLPLGTVKAHVRRGSKRLRELLSAYDETIPVENAK